jgi:hypothetical protein
MYEARVTNHYTTTLYDPTAEETSLNNLRLSQDLVGSVFQVLSLVSDCTSVRQMVAPTAST